MTSFSSLALIVSIFACAITASFGKIIPSVYYMNDRCNGTITVNGDARIKLASTQTLPADKECYLGFQTSSGVELKAYFLSYKINPDYVNETGECIIESIQLYNASGKKQLGASDGYCSKARPDGNFYLGAVGRLRFTTYQSTNILTAVVDLLVSEVNPRSGNLTCSSTNFDCKNGYCVSKDITCNGYDDCGNNADEDDAHCRFHIPPGFIGGIVAGSVFVLVAVFIISFLLYKRRKRASYTQHF